MRTDTKRAQTTRVLLALALGLVVAAPGPVAAPASGVRPSLTSISTSAAAAGSEVVLEGADFGAAESATNYVTFAGVRATTKSWTPNRVVAIVPERSVAGYVGVTVDNLTSNGLWFAPTGRPQVTALSQSIALPGTTVTIFGSGFGSRQGRGWVTFGGVSAPVLSWSNTAVVALVPAVTEAVWVGVWQNGAPSNGLLFAPFGAPRIDSISPSRAQAGERITVTGKNFGRLQGSTSKVKVGSAEMTAVAWSDNLVTFDVPAGTTSGYVGVVRSRMSSNGKMLYIAPRLASISSWWSEPGSVVTLTGQGFTGATRVTFAGTNAEFTIDSDTIISATVPLGAAEGYVGVWNGGTASNGVWFLPIHRARVESLSTSSASPGDSITIYGAHFGDAASGSVVRVGGVNASVVSWSDDRIVATVPSGASSGYVGVWKRSIASNGKWLTVTP